MMCSAELYSKQGRDALKLVHGESLLINGAAPDSFNGRQYEWHSKGLTDLTITFLRLREIITNHVAAASFKIFDFVDVPDTISMSQLKTIRWKGPARGTEQFSIHFSYKENQGKQIVPSTIQDESIDIPDGFFKDWTPGKSKVMLTWSDNVQLQNADDNEAAHATINFRNEKTIWLTP